MVKVRPAPAPVVSSPPFWRTPIFSALALSALALAAYHNSFAVPFVFDDEMAIVANRSLHSLRTAWTPPPELTGLPISGRPVVNFAFGLSHAISGSDVWSYHVFNLAIHVAAGLFLFGVVRRTLLLPAMAPRFGAHGFELAWLIAAIWTVHPLQTESVTYISQRAEAMLGLFYLAALWGFIRAAEPGASSIWGRGAFVACLLGMATKEVMVSAPLFALLYDRAFLAPSWREVWQRRRNLHLLLLSSWLLLGWIVWQEGGARGQSAGFGLGVPWWAYLFKQCEAIVLYLKLSFWPHPLVLDYGTGLVWSLGEVWWQAVIVVVLAGATCWAVARRPVVGCLGAWFFMILAPSSSVVPLVGQTMAEHRMYLPLAAVVVLAVAATYRLLGARALVVLATAAVALVVVTVRRNEDYASPVSICTDTVTKRPDNARAMALLADYHRRAGQLDQARQWLERSLALEPGIRPVLNNLGNIWQELGEPAKAVAFFERVLAKGPPDAEILNNLGNALILSGRVPEGIARLESAVQLAPGSVEARSNLAAVLAANGRLADAAVHLEAAVQLRPEDADFHNRLGFAYARTGRMRQALEQFDTAVRLAPGDEAARRNADLARRRLGGN